MKNILDFRTNTASAAQIAAHLQACDALFTPPLSTRVNIPAYSLKLESLAIRFEAWSNLQLVGLVASYDNVRDRPCAFITSVSTRGEWQGRGVATTLLETCIGRARDTHAEAVMLDVDAAQTAALRLYEHMGFRRHRSRESTLSLRLVLKENSQ